MAKQSNIEWTEATWNPWHGCHKVSAGCKNCYMFRDKARYGDDPNTVVRSKTKFYDPLKWTEPQMIFTCSWSDFFIEEADAWRDEAFAIMALTPQHTYQVLTKRPERMLEYFSDPHLRNRLLLAYQTALRATFGWPKKPVPEYFLKTMPQMFPEMPFSNVWLGVSVEDQKTADERIPLLLQTPAALRWLSIEPLLGPLKLEFAPYYVCDEYGCGYYGSDSSVEDRCQSCEQTYTPNAGDHGEACPHCGSEDYQSLCPRCGSDLFHGSNENDKEALLGLDWVVVGGESGPNARPFDIQWARDIIAQCKAADVPVFVKQLGSHPTAMMRCGPGGFDEGSWSIMPDGSLKLNLKSKKGGDPSEWPKDLRVREMPEVSNGR